MPSFKTGGAASQPFGINEFLFSTKGAKFDHGTFSMTAIPTETFNGVPGQVILQRGETLARITSGTHQGKLGCFTTDAAVTDGRADIANVVGLNDTFLPSQLLNHDETVAYYYDATVVQANCTVRDATGARVPMPDNVAAALVAKKSTSITFRV